MTLPSQKYANNSREVNGVVTVYADDVILRVNTSFQAATINLQEIPSSYWNTQYTLYVYDASSNAATYNITIVAPNGFSIDGAQTKVMSTNGERLKITISSNTSYISESSNTTSGGVASVTSAELSAAVAALSQSISVTSAAAANANSVVSVAAANALSAANTKNPILTILEEASLVVSAPTVINFRGPGVSAKLSAGVVIVSVATGGGAASVTSAQLASAVAALSNSISVTSAAAANANSIVSAAAANALSVANSRNQIITVQDDGSNTISNPVFIDFEGAGVSVRLSGTNKAVVTVPGAQNFFYARKLLETSTVTYIPTATVGQRSFISGTELSQWTSVDVLSLTGFNLSTGIFTAPQDGWYAVNAKLVTRINATDVDNEQNATSAFWMNADTYSAEGIGFFAIGIVDTLNNYVITSNKQVVTKNISDINIDCSIHAIYLSGGVGYAMRIINKTDYNVIGIPALSALPICAAEFIVQKLN